MVEIGKVKESTIRLMSRLALQHGACNLGQVFPNEEPDSQGVVAVGLRHARNHHSSSSPMLRAAVRPQRPHGGTDDGGCRRRHSSSIGCIAVELLPYMFHDEHGHWRTSTGMGCTIARLVHWIKKVVSTGKFTVLYFRAKHTAKSTGTHHGQCASRH